MIIGEVSKQHNDKIVVQQREYKGYEIIDIRQCYKMDDGEYRYTKKGVTLRKEQIHELIKILEEIVDVDVIPSIDSDDIDGQYNSE